MVGVGHFVKMKKRKVKEVEEDFCPFAKIIEQIRTKYKQITTLGNILVNF